MQSGITGGLFAEKARPLYVHSARAELLAANIANAETPGYKARDVDFRSVLSDLGKARVTNPKHIREGYGSAELYRVPSQPTLDGNTVETAVEQAAFAENAVRYQAAIRFLDGSVKTMLLAIKGE